MPPFDWQESLFECLRAGTCPTEIAVPTGLGKTAIMPIWLLALVWQIEHCSGRLTLPRRLVWVVDRRVVVDQASAEAEALAGQVASDPRLGGLLRSISLAGPGDAALAVSTLRGERADNRAWSSDPSRPAIIVGTVDMVGSRLLFSGYGDGHAQRPHHAGLLGQDVLLINDEAHLTPAFANLLSQVAALQDQQKLKPFLAVRLSATPRHTGQRWPESFESDLATNWYFRDVFRASKQLHFHEVRRDEDVLRRASKLAEDASGRVLVFVREPEKAAAVARDLRSRFGSDRVLLMTGTMRGWERDRLAEHPVFGRFAGQEVSQEPCWLVATSAAEVGVNISSDTLVTNLETVDHLIQRFGRLNRFGETNGEAHLVYSAAESERKPRLQSTLAYLRALPSVSPQTLFENPPPLEAYSEEPVTARLSRAILDVWSQTSLHPHPGQPPVEHWLHGNVRDVPETEIAWREEVVWLASECVEPADRREAIRRHRVLAHERLREPTSRVRHKLAQLIPKHGKDPIILIRADGSIEALDLAELAAKEEDLRYALLLLPPGCGSIEQGMFHPDVAGSPVANYDVADCSAQPRRARGIANRDGENWVVRPLGLSSINWPAEEVRLPDLNPSTLDRIAHPLGLELAWEVRIHSHEDESPEMETALLFFREASSKVRRTTEVPLDEHLVEVAEKAEHLAKKLDLPDLPVAFREAGRFHDRGKAAPIWQVAMGGNPEQPLAKTSGPGSPGRLAGFRHELASVLDMNLTQGVPDELVDLVKHFIAAHHGWARPHFPARACDRRRVKASHAEALESARRFGRLQIHYGYWGLAYLEAVFRAADAIASAEAEEQPEDA